MFGFQTVWISRICLVRMCLKSELFGGVLDALFEWKPDTQKYGFQMFTFHIFTMCTFLLYFACYSDSLCELMICHIFTSRHKEKLNFCNDNTKFFNTQFWYRAGEMLKDKIKILEGKFINSKNSQLWIQIWRHASQGDWGGPHLWNCELSCK